MSDTIQPKKESSKKRNKKGKGAGAVKQQSAATAVQPAVNNAETGKGASAAEACKEATTDSAVKHQSTAAKVQPAAVKTCGGVTTKPAVINKYVLGPIRPAVNNAEPSSGAAATEIGSKTTTDNAVKPQATAAKVKPTVKNVEPGSGAAAAKIVSKMTTDNAVKQQSTAAKVKPVVKNAEPGSGAAAAKIVTKMTTDNAVKQQSTAAKVKPAVNKAEPGSGAAAADIVCTMTTDSSVKQQVIAAKVKPAVNKADADTGAAATEAGRKVMTDKAVNASPKSPAATSAQPSKHVMFEEVMVAATTNQEGDSTAIGGSGKLDPSEEITIQKNAVAPPPPAAVTPSDRTDQTPQAGFIKKPIEGAAEKSKAELKAERRAKQEAQRAAKAAGKPVGGGAASKSPPKLSSNTISAAKPTVVRAPDTIKAKEGPAAKVPVSKTKLLSTPRNVPMKITKLYSHLPQRRDKISVIQATKDGIHNAIIRLGLQYAAGVIHGSDARSFALIDALREVIRDFKSVESKDISDALCSLHIDPSMKFLQQCRPSSEVMINISRKLREVICALPKHLTEEVIKENLDDMLNFYQLDEMIKAQELIVNFAKQKIYNGDTILVYGCSSLVKRALVEAHKVRRFRVIAVDSRPKMEGRSMSNYLVARGIPCTYILITGLCAVMKEVTKVFMGANALLADGSVLSRMGTSQVDMVAKAFHKPVIICCETYKLCELISTDPLMINELGNPDDLVPTPWPINHLTGYKDKKCLDILNLYYDITCRYSPTAVACDLGLVPVSSTPDILRFKPVRKNARPVMSSFNMH